MLVDSDMFKKINLSFATVFALIGLLVWLAFLQYSWLEEVRIAQRKQLTESVEAAGENIRSRFNSTLSDIHVLFQFIQADTKQKILYQLRQRLTDLDASHPYFEFTDEILLFESEAEELFSYSPDLSTVTELDRAYIESLQEKKLLPTSQKQVGYQLTQFEKQTLNLGKDESFLVYVHARLPEFTFTQNPSKSLKQWSKQSISFWGNSKFWVILVRLNQEKLQSFLQESLVANYLGQNANELYNWGLTHANEILFTNDEQAILPDSADVRLSIGELKGNAVIFIQSETSVSTVDGFDFKVLQDIKTNSYEYKIESEFPSILDKKIELKDRLRNINPDSILSINVFKGDRDEQLATSTYQFFVQSKSGSLDAFVNQTKWKNLSLSFGILGLLGLSLVMIAWNANRLKETAHQQMDFVAGVSHELKTPLAVIRSAAENVADGVITKEDQLKKYGKLIVAEGQRLTGMVEQILEFAGIQAGNNPIKRVDVSSFELARELESESLLMVQNQGFELHWYQHPQLPIISADTKYMKAAFMNLLTNALKYSDKEKRILVRWSLTDWRKQRALAISVQDFGMGIHPSDQKKLFKPFFRTDEAKAKQIRGNGLGLHLVKRWMLAHNGDIELESKPGLGSTFTLFIPISA